ncbi:MAG: hypothetical protein AAFN48_08400 [Pseudomonadota bacterium]
MTPRTRAMVAAAAFVVLTSKKVAGVFDHSAGKKLRIAAERRGDQVQAFDAENQAHFGGTLPELYDAGTKAHVAFHVDIRAPGETLTGHDRHSASDFTARVEEDCVQVYDYADKAWFAYDIQDPNAAKSFHRAG